MNGESLSKESLDGLESMIRSAIVGQDRAVSSVASWVKRGERGLLESGKPAASFCFLGPTGVGKTQLAKEFTRGIGGELAFFDMSVCSRAGSVQELLGSRRTEGLFAALLDPRIKTVLLDEIEKAHGTVRDLLIPMLGEGRVILANGQVVSLEGRYVVMTSNLASEVILKAQGGMGSSLSRFVRNEALKFLRPETYGRIDLVEVFQPLSFAHRVEIGRRIAAQEVARLKALGHPAENVLGDTLLAMCAKDCDLGVRPLKRKIQSIIQEALLAKA